jgi:hypothetical protein
MEFAPTEHDFRRGDPCDRPRQKHNQARTTPSPHRLSIGPKGTFRLERLRVIQQFR